VGLLMGSTELRDLVGLRETKGYQRTLGGLHYVIGNNFIGNI